MNFQIEKIILYNKNGEQRLISLNKKSVNIITGDSNTGKSSLIDIIDYCLCSKSCNTKDIILEYVKFYALLLINISTNCKLYIARKSPDKDKHTSSHFYIVEGIDIEIPDIAKLKTQTHNIDGAEAALNDFMGMSSEKIDLQKHGRLDVRNSLPFCFQSQSSFTNSNYLFHNQNDYYKAEAIKLCLPYFLNIYSIDTLKNKKKLKQLEDNLRESKQKYKKSEEDKCNIHLSLKKLNITEKHSTEWLESALESIVNSIDGFNEEYIKLYDTYHGTKIKISLLEEKLKVFDSFSSNTINYSSSISGDKIDRCPLCENNLTKEIPTIEDIHKDIVKFNHHKTLSNRLKENIENQLREYREDFEHYNKMIKTFSIFKSDNSKGSTQIIDKIETIVRIKNILAEQDDNTLPNIKELKSEIKELEEKVKESHLDRLSEIIEEISEVITNIQQKFDKSDTSRYRLDIDHLTIWKISENSTTGVGKPLSCIGGGANLMYIKLAIYLSLHKYFNEKNRTVPSFIVIDQPSQVFSGAGKNDDIKKKKLFEEIINNNNGTQILLLEHATSPNDDWFNKYMVEKHWSDDKLIPKYWIDNQ